MQGGSAHGKSDPGESDGPTQAGGAWRSRVDGVAVAAVGLAIAALYVRAYRRHPSHPHIAGTPGWWAWFDQERYFKAAAAWSHLDLTPASHWYLPGYPLMGAPFVRLFAAHAFLLPDLLCLLASLWLFSRLAGCLATRLPRPPVLGAVLFAAVTALSPLGLDIWVVPWSTTGATPFVYACLLGAVRFIDRPDRARFAFLSAFAGGLVAAFRPTDVVPLLLACVLGMAVAALRARSAWRPLVAGALAGAGGLALALGVLLAAYLPIYGLAWSDYIVSSGSIGFDWGLVPLRWVVLMLDPRPLLSDGQGLVEAFPWIAAGFAGLAVFLVLELPRSDRLRHATVVLAVSLHVAVYLAYRDMHSGGLFRFWNYHYFKWVYPVLALYGALLFHALLTEAGRRLRIGGVAVACLCLLLPWRAELRVTGAALPAASDAADHVVSFDSGLASVRDGLLVAATGEWGAIYFGPQAMTIAGHDYGYFDFRTFPRSGGFLLAPLRPMATGPARLTLDSRVLPDPSVAPLHVRQEIRFGRPCWLPGILYDCPPQDLLPPPVWPAGGTLVFHGAETPFLTGDWSYGEPDGRWTAGSRAGIRMRLPSTTLGTATATAYALAVVGSAYVPPGSPPLDVRVLLDGHEVATHQLATGETVTLPATLPAARLGIDAANGATLTIQVANPRSPADHDRGSSDTRPLGLFVRSISLAPLPAE
jgi:hypothetical protein